MISEFDLWNDSIYIIIQGTYSNWAKQQVAIPKSFLKQSFYWDPIFSVIHPFIAFAQVIGPFVGESYRFYVDLENQTIADPIAKSQNQLGTNRIVITFLFLAINPPFYSSIWRNTHDS